VLGRELAGWIAGDQPLALLGEATFHYADVAHDPDPDATDAAGVDDLDAALAAGFQTRLPGWAWREDESPFSV
jgi:homogentisate 1,2-dioxygenase